MAKSGRAHIWTGKKRQFCENCGRDKPTDSKAAAVKDCRPTNLGGGIGGW